MALNITRRSSATSTTTTTYSRYPDVTKTIYVIMGFASAPADQAEVGKTCTENLAKFAEVFLMLARHLRWRASIQYAI